MAEITEEDVLNALRSVHDTEGKDIVSQGMIQSLRIKEGRVQLAIEINPADGDKLEPLRRAAEQAVAALPGVSGVTAVLTADRVAPPPPPPPAAHGHGHKQQGPQKISLPSIYSILAVASGKGGVGKSTTSANLACAMAKMGLRVGLLDADIYGPSQPRMLGLSGKPESPDGKIIEPLRNHGVACMSIGFLVDDNDSVVWRGPMVMSAVQSMLKGVHWGDLDVLLVDLPPGTGDAQITMATSAPLTGSVVVSTPQDIALLDTRKGLDMFVKVGVPVLGIIENMSYFVCSHCGGRTDIFSHGGAHREADRLDVPFLGEIPLDIAIRETADNGTPIVIDRPDSEHAKRYLEIAEKLWTDIKARVEAAKEATPQTA